MPDDEIVSGKAREGQTEDDVVRSLSADVAFAKLGNDTRLEILHVLFQSDSPLNFSDVMNAVGVQDSGRFNYHLDKLLEIFVRHTSDGYELTRAGTTVIGGVLAGEYTKSFDTSPVSLETPCPSCDCSLTGEFTNDYVQIGCQSCGRILIKLEVPPGAFEAYPRKEWPHYVDQMARQEFSMLDAGFCTVCRGPISSHIDLNTNILPEKFEAAIHYECDRCAADVHANAELCILSHPALTSFYYNHGENLNSIPIWELDWAVNPRVTVVADNPVKLDVPIELDGDKIVFSVEQMSNRVEVSVKQ